MPASTSVARTKVSLFGCENWHRFSSFSVVSCVLPGSSAGCGRALAALWSSGSDHGSGSQQRPTPSGSAAQQSQMAEKATAHALFFRTLIKVAKMPSFHSSFCLCQCTLRLCRSAEFGLQALWGDVFKSQLFPTELMENGLSCTCVAHPLVFTLVSFSSF